MSGEVVDWLPFSCFLRYFFQFFSSHFQSDQLGTQIHGLLDQKVQKAGKSAIFCDVVLPRSLLLERCR